MEAFFLPAAHGHRFCVHRSPEGGQIKGALLYLHPWAEEMNKSRRMVALQSRALVAAGFAVLQIDLHGCGDSSGDFADATWEQWVEDALLGVRWLRDRHGPRTVWLWGLRGGVLVATAAAHRLAQPVNLLLWHPVASGKQMLEQFLRLKAAAEMRHGGGKSALVHARSELAAGRSVDIAGYALPPALAQGLEAAQVDLPECAKRVIWFDLTTRDEPALLPTSCARIDTWRAAGCDVQAQAVRGPAFWQTQEIEEAPELLAATLAALTLARSP